MLFLRFFVSILLEMIWYDKIFFRRVLFFDNWFKILVGRVLNFLFVGVNSVNGFVEEDFKIYDVVFWRIKYLK